MNGELAWFKSSYSDTEGNACVEVAMAWHKSTYSDTEGNNCVEVAACPRSVHVRDSKLGVRGAEIDVDPGAWGAFIRRTAAR